MTYELDLDSENFAQDLRAFLKILISRSSNFLIESKCLKVLSKQEKKNPLSDSGPFSKRLQSDRTSGISLYSQPRHHASLSQGFNMWLLKPADKNRGRGIKIFHNLESFCDVIRDYENFDDFNLASHGSLAFNSPKSDQPKQVIIDL